MSANIVITQTEAGWTVSGKTFDVKDLIKAVGGKWQPDTRTWFIEATKDIAALLKAKADDEAARAEAAVKAKAEAIRDGGVAAAKEAAVKAKAERKTQRAFNATPEGMEAKRVKMDAARARALAAEKAKVLWALAEKKRTPEGARTYYFVCCEQCEVIDWRHAHTSCRAHAEWDGQSWNCFRVRGSIFTGT